jgi:hypothetical protein
MGGGYRIAVALAACAATGAAWSSPPVSPLPPLQEIAGIETADLAPDPAQLEASPTRADQFPLYRAMMGKPLHAPYRAGLVADACRDSASSAHDLMQLAGHLAGVSMERSPASTLQPIERALRAETDPLAASVGWMRPLAPAGSPWPPRLPDEEGGTSPLRFEVAMVLATVGRAHRFLGRALARVPASLTPARLARQALEGRIEPLEEPDFRRLLPEIEREALLAGMLDLVAAVQRLRAFVAGSPSLPAVAWRIDTPLGAVVVDTTGRDNVHALHEPLLVVDVGGNDRYEFGPRAAARRIAVLLDHGGDDRYLALAPGADPSAAILGYGVLWDTAGDDDYRGSQVAQASALFGAALLVDEGGRNEFTANGHAQGHAIGGVALLLGGAGDDRYRAQTHAQGSGGPSGVAMLVDPAGNDRYTLDDSPLSSPSPQLPDRNTSMGQGAGRGLRTDVIDGRSAAGGIGVLVDLEGDDQYRAQVFAQGAGFREGLGLLADGAGNDRFEAAWYAMGAAAHRGAGVLLKRGAGHDRYRATHTLAIGAAHDFSVGFFLDEGGDDRYHAGDLGLGAAHDNSVALFVDAAGDDAYGVDAGACRAFGVARLGEWGSLRESLPNAGLFMDLGGDDAYPAHCERARNDAGWAPPREQPARKLRSESGAGIDGRFPSPFATGRLTRPRQP